MSPPSRRFAALAAALAAAAAGCVERRMPEGSFGLDCVLDFRMQVTECAHLDRQTLDVRPGSDSRDLHLRSVEARRDGGALVADVELAGPFASDADQNIYVLAGADGGRPTTYSLSEDPAYFEDAGHPVRGAVTFPHALDVRTGILSARPASYSPQVYLRDPRAAEAAGPGAGVVQRVHGARVHVEIPLARYYAVRGEPVPERLGVTVATARDYVGFVDQATVLLAGDGAPARARGGTPPPADYPTLDPESHVLSAVRLVRSDGGVTIEIETRAPVRDWAQTNIHFFLLPVEPYRAAARLLDPSGARALPYKWSHYCGVYSPRRVFCKASNGKDFTFDSSYSERPALAPPEGAAFRVVGDGRYALDLAPETVVLARAGRPTFAVMVAVGRDGFAPTSFYGASGVEPPP